MSRILFFLGLFLIVKSSFSQYEKCMTMPQLARHEAADQTLKKRLIAVEENARQWLLSNPDAGKRSNTVLTIPVVVHVVWNTPAENIPDSQIVSQIAVLNEDYRRQNLNYVNTRDVFDTISADIEVEFCLASVDPQGNPTNGITRTQTNVTSFDPVFNFDKVKSSSTGGKDPWPSSDYLNLWVCDMSLFGSVFVLGYAQFPGDDPATDGVVIQYQHFGRVGYPGSAPADLGRTATHEVGHWLGMRHIWGDDQGACDSTDYVDDTPNCGDNSQTTCNVANNTCNDSNSVFWTSDVPDMIENYMDYSTDACMTMFTQGQKARMWSFLNTARASLANSNGCGLSSGLKQVISDVKFDLYPNPAEHTLNVEIGTDEQVTLISIYNSTGSMVERIAMNGIRKQVIDLSSYSNGIYLLKVTGGMHAGGQKKFVISR